MTGAATGVAPSIAVAGTDANINLQLTPKGTGGIIIGTGGQPIAGHFSVSTSLNFGTAMAAGQCENLTATVTGAVVGDTVIATLTAVAGGAESFVTASAHIDIKQWVSAANTVTVQECNNGSAAVNPVAETFRIDVWHH